MSSYLYWRFKQAEDENPRAQPSPPSDFFPPPFEPLGAQRSTELDSIDLAARMKSFCERPWIAWEVNVRVTLFQELLMFG
jgi:hypothetical protein